ncbi:hydantoinase B/oxoprolinase family protein [Rhodococcoides kyotonense]|uniref:N-methylhydantoinase B n=1 Tax=Rhodococcoides kyotonense TaxID=398843 RepID=A0A239MYY8_9NOCA|nr:hydantoinase B/oxoprolinase family protein [Rhodococcus kyotonensis]SNT47443.1 N-methylhydantoinase B [Rhodococcus kyotonensis]
MLSNINPVGSCEGYEREIPYLYLYRRELPASGGHGQFRGGATFTAAVTGHHTDENYISSGGLFQSVTQGIALAGAPPAPGGVMWHATDTKVLDEMAAGRVPADTEQVKTLAPHGAPPPPKKFDNRLLPGDIFATMSSAGAGYGDPVLRDPELVLGDERAGRLLAGEATSVYGVVITDGAVDEEKTSQTREAMLRDRLGRAVQPHRVRTGKVDESAVTTKVLATVLIGENNGNSVFGCAHCRETLSDSDISYRHGSAIVEVSLDTLGPLFSDPVTQTGVDLKARTYLCPSCGIALDTEVVVPNDPIVDDVVLSNA